MSRQTVSHPTPRTSTHQLNWKNINLLPKTSGIYYVYGQTENDLLYIGQTKNFQSRLYNHLRINRFLGRHSFIKIESITDPIERVRRERKLIRQHKPVFNVACTPRKYQPIFRVFNEQAYQFVQAMRHIPGESFFGPRTVRFWNEKQRPSFYAASYIQQDGSVLATRSHKLAYITNLAQNWHALKYYFRQIPETWAHECPPANGLRFGNWEYDSKMNSVCLWVKKGWPPRLHVSFERISNDYLESESAVLHKLNCGQHVDSLWEAARVIMGVIR
jgi:predicted GIY-YIG superfamily endonuclease